MGSVFDLSCDVGDKACQGINIEGTQATYINVKCEEGDYCDDLKLKCPDKLDVNTNIGNCYLTALGDDNENIQIYSKLGFESFRLTDTNTSTLQLHCNNEYKTNCNINSQNNLCVDNPNKCHPYNNNSQIKPTAHPTCFTGYFESEIVMDMLFDVTHIHECDEVHYELGERLFKIKLQDIIFEEFKELYDEFSDIAPELTFNFDKWWEEKVEVTIDFAFASRAIDIDLFFYTNNIYSIENYLNQALNTNALQNNLKANIGKEFNKIIGKSDCILITNLKVVTILNPCSMETHKRIGPNNNNNNLDIKVIALVIIVIIVVVCIIICAVYQCFKNMKQKYELKLDEYRKNSQAKETETVTLTQQNNNNNGNIMIDDDDVDDMKLTDLNATEPPINDDDDE